MAGPSPITTRSDAIIARGTTGSARRCSPRRCAPRRRRSTRSACSIPAFSSTHDVYGRSWRLPNRGPQVAETVNHLPKEASSWYGVGAPKATPAEIIEKLNKEINAGLADPKIEGRLANLGGDVLALSP